MGSSQRMRIATALVLVIVLALVARQTDAWWFFSEDKQQTAPSVPALARTAASLSAPANATQATTAAEVLANSRASGAQGQQQPAQELRAVARFDLDGVKGTFKFVQHSPQEPTRVEYDLQGLRGNNRLYHVHVRPVPEHNHEQVRQNSSLIGQLCADPATGGHLNPHKITQKLPPKSAPFDRYEIGDLSGKHGPLLELTGQPDHYVGTYTDDKLPMTGANSIVGRSIVIHKNDGARWVCASILPLA